jgi:replicative DNA helicase
MSQELEAKVLNAILADRYLFSRATADGANPDIFRDPSYKIIFTTAKEMAQSPGQVIDWITIEENIKAKSWFTPEIEKALEAIKDSEKPDADQVMAYIGILKESSVRTQIGKLANVLADYSKREGEHQDDDIVDFSGRIIQSLVDMQKKSAGKKISPVSETIVEIRDIANNRDPEANNLLGFPIHPYQRIQEVLSGVRKGFYYGLAGPPRRGKTTLTLDIACRLAEQNNFPVLFYTWEQTKRTLAARLLGRDCYINPVTLLTEVSPLEQRRLTLLNKVIDKSTSYSNKLFIIECGRQDTIERIKAQAYNLMHEFRTDNVAIFFDYLQKIPLNKQYEDIRSQVNEASAQLADLSLQLNCPVIAISSMDKEGCKLDEKPPSYDEFSSTYFARPTMHNCVGGGDIEYDLDVAMILSKDWVATKNLQERLSLQGKEEKNKVIPQIDIINLHVDKNRDSSGEKSPTVQLAFFININKFVEVGFKFDDEYTKEFKGFAKAEDMFAALLDTGIFRL